MRISDWSSDVCSSDLYRKTELGRLSFIRRARDLGFPLDQVRALLSLSDDRTRDCATVDALARDHLADIERKIVDLTELQCELTMLLASCEGGTVADCRILEALAPPSIAQSRL